MNRSRTVLLTALLTLGLAAAGAVPAGSARAATGARPSVATPTSVVGLGESAPAMALNDDGTVAVLVQLDGPTALQLLRFGPKGDVPLGGTETPRVDAAYGAVDAELAAARPRLEAAGARIIDTYDTAMNGFLAYVSPDQVSTLGALPGVRAVYLAPRLERQLEDVTPEIGADEVATDLGFAGQGVVVAIVDTGIDYTHKNLGGSGRTQDYDRALQDPARTDGLFPNSKVIGGWDFAGSGYTGGNAPSPDEDPIDEDQGAGGHGSHVAGIAAGADSNRKLHAGVAKDASLIALKVFGRQGGTNLEMSAVEWAMETNVRGRPPEGKGSCRLTPCHIDVMNLSLGAPFAYQVMDKIGTVKDATDAGIVFVAAAGNDGDAGFITGSPAAAAYALSVASTWPAGEKADMVKITYADGTDESLEALEGDVSLTKQMSAVGDLKARLMWFGRGCPGDRQEGDVTGRIALIQRGTCEFKVKLDAAVAAGAVGAIVYSDGRDLVAMPSTSGATSIPAYMISTDDGEQLQKRVADLENITAEFSKQWKDSFTRDYITDVISSFSSRGPSLWGPLKPNVAAPGSQINSVAKGSGDGGRKLDGTSMASPVAAGAAAVLVQRARADGLAAEGPLKESEGLGAVDIAALLVNGADNTVWEGDSRKGVPVGLARGGAGRIDLSTSARLETVVRAEQTGSEQVTPYGLMFGFPVVDDVYTAELPFSIKNASSAERHYHIGSHFLFADDAASGVSFVPSEEDVTVAPGERKTLQLALHIDPLAMKRYNAYGGDRAQTSLGMTDAEHDALLDVTEVDAGGTPVAGGDVARLPIYVLPKVVSEDRVTDATIAEGSGGIKVANPGAQPGLAEFFQSLGEDSREANLDAYMDIDRVGARVVTDAQGERVIEVLVHTRAPRKMPSMTQAYVGFDTDRNGSIDWLAASVDAGWVTDPTACPVANFTIGGPMVTAVYRVTSQSPLSTTCGTGIVDRFPGVDLGSSTIVVPVTASLLGYGPSQPIAFDAFVMHRVHTHPIFSWVVSQGKASGDIAPNDAMNGNAVGTGRFHFHEDGAGVVLADPTVDVAARGETTVAMTLAPGATQGSQVGPLLAYYPSNKWDADVELVDIRQGALFTTALYLPSLMNRFELPR